MLINAKSVIYIIAKYFKALYFQYQKQDRGIILAKLVHQICKRIQNPGLRTFTLEGSGGKRTKRI